MINERKETTAEMTPAFCLEAISLTKILTEKTQMVSFISGNRDLVERT